jgi:hypothetical protein
MKDFEGKTLGKTFKVFRALPEFFRAACCAVPARARAAGQAGKMPRAAWAGWSYFQDNSGADVKHPRKCKSCGKVLPDDATKARCYLAFHCAAFAEHEPEERDTFALSFAGTNTKLTADEVKQLRAVQSRRRKRPAEDEPWAGRREGFRAASQLGESTLSAPLVSSDVFLHGVAGAKLRLSSAGDNLLQQLNAQKMSTAVARCANDLLFRWLVVANLPLSCFDYPEWEEFLQVSARGGAAATAGCAKLEPR